MNGCGREVCFNPYCLSCPCNILIILDRKDSFTKESLLKLLEKHIPIEACQKNRTPKSLQNDDIKYLNNIEGKKGKLKEFTNVLKDWEKVFSSRIALGLSFRNTDRKIDSKFLDSSADFDYEALDGLANLCHKNDKLNKLVIKSLVRHRISLVYCVCVKMAKNNRN